MLAGLAAVFLSITVHPFMRSFLARSYDSVRSQSSRPQLPVESNRTVSTLATAVAAGLKLAITHVRPSSKSASSSSIGYPRDVAETITRAGFDSGIVSYQSDQLVKTSALFFHLIFWRNCVLSSLVLVTMAPS